MNLREVAIRLREVINIVDLVSEYVALKKVGRNYVGLCPFHTESKPSFTVSEEKQIFRCFGCGAGGDAIGFYMRISGLSFPEAVRELAQRYHLPLPRGDSGEGKKYDRLYRVNEKALRFFRHLLKSAPEAEIAREHLREREISESTAENFALGYAPAEGSALAAHLRLSGVDLALAEEAGLILRREDGSYYDRFRGRLIFPLRDQQGRVVAFAGRILGPGEPKYLNSPETPVYHKSRYLYGLYEARSPIRERGFGLVVEGYFDLLSLWEKGIRNVVATCGTALTREHARLLKRLLRTWYLVFDGDEAGRRAAYRALGVFFQEGIFPRVVFLPQGEDPDSLVRRFGPEAMEELLPKARSPESFLVDYVRQAFPPDPEGKSAAVAEVRKILSGVPDPVIRYEYARRVAEGLDVPERFLLESPPQPTPPTSTPAAEDPFGKLILQALLHHPSLAAELKALRVEDLLRDPAQQSLYLRLLEALEEGCPPERFSPEDPELQSLYSELFFSPFPEDSAEKILLEIKESVLRRRFRERERERFLREIKEAESSGRKEDLARLLKAYADLCLERSIKRRGEGVYESFSS